jgi:hypothetical protein
MDRFARPADSDERGLSDAELSLDARPAPQLVAGLAAHRFWSPLDGGGYGTEIDVTGRWSFSPFGSLGFGGAWFRPDPTFDPDPRLYGYLELDASF